MLSTLEILKYKMLTLIREMALPMPSGMSGVIFLTNIANFSLSISTK